MDIPNDPHAHDEETKLISSAKDPNSLSLSSLSLLTRPSAELLGQEFRDFLEVQINRLKKTRREQNLEAHIHRVHERLQQGSAEEPTTLKKVKFFEEWSKAVQDVDPEDEVLSAIWEKLFVEMAKGRDVEEILVEKLKRLTSADAEVLLAFREKPSWYPTGERRQFIIGRLRDLGIVRRSFNPRIRIALITLTVLTFYFGPLRWWAQWMSETRGPRDKEETPAVLTITGLNPIGLIIYPLMAAAMLGALSGYGANHWRLTWIGKDLLIYADGVRRPRRH